MSSKGLDPRGKTIWILPSAALHDGWSADLGHAFFNNIVVESEAGADMGLVQAGLHSLLINGMARKTFNIRTCRYHRHANETQNSSPICWRDRRDLAHCRGIWRDNIMLVSVTERTGNRHRMALARQLRRVVSISNRGVMVCFIAAGGCRPRRWRRVIYLRDACWRVISGWHDCHCLRGAFLTESSLAISGQKSRTTRPRRGAGSGLETTCVLVAQVRPWSQHLSIPGLQFARSARVAGACCSGRPPVLPLERVRELPSRAGRIPPGRRTGSGGTCA